MEINIQHLVRENIKNLRPYSTARHEFTGQATVMLDANENSFGSPISLHANALNRYPEPIPSRLINKISSIKGIPPKNIFTGNGSDEAIDVLFRIFCEPGIDNVITLNPTYGMYSVAASINDVQVKEVALDENFQIHIPAIIEAIDNHTKMIFICSPNNPSGNSIRRNDIEIVLHNFDGIVVIDEAYINYAKQKSFSQEIIEYPNLIVLQTLSKAWGMASLRLGLAFAQEEIIALMNQVKYPYNVNLATQELALQGLEKIDQVNHWTKETINQRTWLEDKLAQLSFVQKIYPSDANFLLAKMDEAEDIFHYLQKQGVIVRNRNNVKGCEGCLRITIGTENENHQLIEELKKYKKS